RGRAAARDRDRRALCRPLARRRRQRQRGVIGKTSRRVRWNLGRVRRVVETADVVGRRFIRAAVPPDAACSQHEDGVMRSRSANLGRGLLFAAFSFALSLSAYACGDGSPSGVTTPPDTGPTTPPVLRTFDLRFKGVGTLSDSIDLAHQNLFVGTGSALTHQLGGAAGTPLQLGASNLCNAAQCVWFFDAFALPSDVVPVGVIYAGSILANLDETLNAKNTDTNAVITAMDIRPTPGVFGISEAVTPKAGGYHLSNKVVPLADLPATAAAEGAQKRVITAVSFDSGQVRYLSYAWDHDTTTNGYDTQVVEAAQAGVPAAAEQLGTNGYVVTAVGGNAVDGFILVGTRVHGATGAQTVAVDPAFSDILPGYAIIADLVDDAGTVTFIYQL